MPLLTGAVAQQGILGAQAQGVANQNAVNSQNAQNAAAQQQQMGYLGSLGFNAPSSISAQGIYGGGTFAAGGPVTLQSNIGEEPVSVTMPQAYVNDIENGGLSALQVRGYATGGGLQTLPINPGSMYPQALIQQAQPLPGATPMRHEVVGRFEDGGMIDGPGDGQSDDVPAIVNGHEPVKLADAEYIIPADVVSALGNGSSKAGAKVLDKTLKGIRMAAHGKSRQMKQDAGRLALERSVERQMKRRGA
jgi:hypothetical protein